MKYLILFSMLLPSCGTHNVPKGLYKIVNKTGALITLSNNADTLLLGDTLGISFNLKNNIILDDNTNLNLTSIINTGCGYKFLKKIDTSNKLWYFWPEVLEQKQSYLQIEGRFFFKPALKQLIGSTIHYLPKDTGYYILSTERNQYIVANVEGSPDQYQINLFPEFDVPDVHDYLLDSFPEQKIAVHYAKEFYAEPYYVFYVKPK